MSLFRHWNPVMPEWDDIFRDKGHVFLEPHPDMKRLIGIFHGRNVRRILDLGCGTGRHTVFLSTQGFEVYGTDASERAIELTHDWLAQSEISAELVCHRMEHPFPFADDFFDAIIAVQVLHHNLMCDILNTVREIGRMLRKGGVLFISVPIMKEKPVTPKDDWDLKEIEEGTFIPQRGPEQGIPHHYFTPEELHRVFSGFDILEMFLDESDHRCIIAIKK